MTAAAAFDFDRIEVRDVSRQYGRRRALTRATLTCTAGSITALIGPNGAGKTTLLGILSTIVRPTSGEVRYGEATAAAGADALRARIGVLGHDLFLYDDLTALENLIFFARIYGVDQAPARAAAAIQAARLTGRGDDRVRSFSRGLRQRLALERALIHQPRLVLLDEPFTGLDDESAALLGERLRGLREQGAIVLMATHDFEHADGLVDRAIGLRAGKLRTIEGQGPLRARYRAAMAEAW